jgi:23S rRNA pseudouridine1911/1915/1917 synthase
MATRKATFSASREHAGKRVDQFLVSQLADTSRARIQQLIRHEKVLVNGRPARPSLLLRGGETVEIIGEVERPPLRAIAERIPLEILYEDDDLAVVNKPAGMMVHAGSGATDDARNRGTLVNALVYRFGALSTAGGAVRPGIVHRLDKETSGLMVVAKNDLAHHGLAAQFAGRKVSKSYVALVHGWLKNDRGTISMPISRDAVRRTRMTTRRSGGREAVTHYEVVRKIGSAAGNFTLLKLRIETGRTHQIRVHLASVGHPVAGDTVYGAPRTIRSQPGPALSLARHFLHSSELQFAQPRTGGMLSFSLPIPDELNLFLRALEVNREAGKKL